MPGRQTRKIVTQGGKKGRRASLSLRQEKGQKKPPPTRSIVEERKPTPSSPSPRATKAARPTPLLRTILERYPRLGVTGYPDVGKTAVTERIEDRPIFNAGLRSGDGMTPDHVGTAHLSDYWCEVLRRGKWGRYVVDGVFLPRVFRKSLRKGLDLFDAVLWIKPWEGWQPDDRRQSFRRAMDTVWTQAREENEKRDPGRRVAILQHTSSELVEGLTVDPSRIG